MMGFIWGVQLIYKRGRVGRLGYLKKVESFLEYHLFILSSPFSMVVVFLGKKLEMFLEEKLEKAWEK
jgi:hypothetical protein